VKVQIQAILPGINSYLVLDPITVSCLVINSPVRGNDTCIHLMVLTPGP
jgi:hypothetical protein